MVTGTVPVPEFFAPPNLARLLGWPKTLRLAAGELLRRRRPRA